MHFCWRKMPLRAQYFFRRIKKEEISSYNSRGIIVWKLLFVSLRCSLFFSSYFLRDCLRAVSSFLVTIVFLSLGKFFTIIAKKEKKVNIYIRLSLTAQSSHRNTITITRFTSSFYSHSRNFFRYKRKKNAKIEVFQISQNLGVLSYLHFMQRYFSLFSVGLLRVLLLYTRLSKRS